MLVFRHFRSQVRVRSLVSATERCFQCRDAMGLLLAAARLECAISDYKCELEHDRDGGVSELLRGTMLVADWLLGGECPDWTHFLRGIRRQLPDSSTVIPASEPEGCRYYGLSPLDYAAPAGTWRLQHGHRFPGAWVIGLRTAGSVFAPVVASTIGTALPLRISTLRPRGDAYDRATIVRPSLERAIRAWNGAFLIVDEGPGLSGSSFGGTVRLLHHLGITEDSVFLFAGGSPDPARLRSSYASEHWADWKPYVATTPKPPPGFDFAQDIGAGRWRRVLGNRLRPPVWPQHERHKFLSRDGHTIAKFSGLGQFGRTTLDRALRLARAGFSPAPNLARSALDQGWIVYPRVRCHPLTHRVLASRSEALRWIGFAARYLAWVRSEFALAAFQPPSSSMLAMVEANSELARKCAVRLTVLPESPPAVQVALDARMQPQEWGYCCSGWVKFDAADDSDDPFFPGPADIAWDLGAIEVEFGRHVGDAVIDAYARISGDAGTALRRRIQWHRRAYALFRLAFCRMAAECVGGCDHEHFLRQAARLTSVLQIQCLG